MKMQSLSSASFNSYSPSDKLSQIAARVVNEFQSNDDFMLEYTDYDDDKIFLANNNNNNNNQQQQQEEDEEEEEDDEGEFEFPDQAALSPVPADEIFSNGQIRPVYPLFNTELVFGKSFPNTNSVTTTTSPKASARLPLGKLFMEERENCASCSSSESDELEGVPSETYCVWKPNTGDHPGELRKKSSSTGTSNRWKLRGLLHKSNSDGNDSTFDFLNTRKGLEGAGKETAAPQQHFTKKGPVKENHVRRSYLPYKKDLVELFFSVNGVSRHVNPY